MTVLATLYTMKGCDHCDKMKPIWKTFLAKQDKNKDHVNEVDCSREREVCSAQEIRGVPAVIFTKSSEPDFKMEHVGPRTANALQKTLNILTNSRSEKARKST